MARLRERNPQDTSGAYARQFGDPQLGLLFSKVRGLSIAAGHELRAMVATESRQIGNLAAFLAQGMRSDGVWLVTRKVMQHSQLFGTANLPDFLLFRRKGKKQHCYIISLKLGHSFDSKRSSAEIEDLRRFWENHARRIPCPSSVHVCAFNKNKRDDIVTGFKQKITREEAMPGNVLCDLLGINYDQMVAQQQGDQADNFAYLMEALLQIPKVRAAIKQQLGSEPSRLRRCCSKVLRMCFSTLKS